MQAAHPTLVPQLPVEFAAHAEALGARGPSEHEAQAEAEREAAWVAALEAEAEQPGLWMTTLDPDATGSLDGHPSLDEGAHQVWLGAALEVAGAADLDLLISGLGLPDGSGLELMIRIRVRHVVTGIALSGFGRDKDIQRSREAGFVGHLTKPVDFRRLEAMIRQVAS